MDKKPIRVLQVIADFKKGGVQAEVIWPARILDSNDVKFDVLLLSDTVGYYEEEFSNYGEIYRIIKPSHKTKITRAIGIFTDYFYIKRKFKNLIQRMPEYDAIHSHHIVYNAPILEVAKKRGIPVRIAHCAVNKPEGKSKDRLYFRVYLWLCSKSLSRTATERLGVTQNAADYVFGKGKGRPIKNPTLDLTKFNPDLYKRENTEVLTLIMVGSFSPRKNQEFAVDILNEIKKDGQACKLIMIGYPRNKREEYLPRLIEKIDKLDLSDNVEILPQDSDIPYYLAQSDFMIMPSLQEGLPNVVLESQAMGLPCILSSDVANDCDCGLCAFLPLSERATYWADYLIKEYQATKGTRKYVDMSEWDNREISEQYLEMWRGNTK